MIVEAHNIGAQGAHTGQSGRLERRYYALLRELDFYTIRSAAPIACARLTARMGAIGKALAIQTRPIVFLATNADEGLEARILPGRIVDGKQGYYGELVNTDTGMKILPGMQGTDLAQAQQWAREAVESHPDHEGSY